MGFWTAFVPGGGHAPRNEFAAPELGNFTLALLGSFHLAVTASDGMSSADRMRVRRSEGSASKSACISCAARCSVLADGDAAPTLARISWASRAGQWLISSTPTRAIARAGWPLISPRLASSGTRDAPAARVR